MFQSSREKQHQSFMYSSLEERRLLAGDVRVVENVNLYIRGDNLDNQVEIVVDGDDLRVNGLDGTTINGKQSFVVQGASVTESGVTFEGGLRAHFGPGHDDVLVRDAIFESKSIVYGGTGDDDIKVMQSQFLGGAVIQTYDGNDSISAMGSQFEDDFYAITLNGQDSVNSIDNVFNGKSIVSTGEHSDSILSENSQYMGDVNLILSLNGDDNVQLTNPVVGESQLGVFLGNHNDVIGVDLTEAVVDGSIRIGGQAGIDEPSSMNMSAEMARKTVVGGFEKEALVFESELGGIENAIYAQPSYTAFYDSSAYDGTDIEPSTDAYAEQYATSVVLETTQTISQIEWSGAYRRYFSGREDLLELDDNFVIEIFEGTVDPDDIDAYRPLPPVDASSITRFEVGTANRVEVGERSFDFEAETITIPFYEYHADIEYTMEAGKRYWVSIYTELDGDQAAFGNTWGWGAGEEITSETLSNIGTAALNESMWSSTAEDRAGAYFLQKASVDTAMDLRLRGQ
jgi:hypothetical protein